MLNQQSERAITLPGDIHASVDRDADGQGRVCFRRLPPRRSH
jgi:hypothetical protein